MFPDFFAVTGLDDMKTFAAFDNAYTAPHNGFADAGDYWAKSSCGPLLGTIDRSTLMVSARNDPFLSQSCFPVQAAEENPHLTLMMPKEGGHVGFPSGLGRPTGWLENTVTAFLTPALGYRAK